MRSGLDIENVLRQFRDWLEETADESAAEDSGAAKDGQEAPPTSPRLDAEMSNAPDVGLLQMAEAFSAMRHEIKLYTKGTRKLEGAVERALEDLGSAVRAFHSVQTREREVVQGMAGPMVEALIQLHESLLRAEQVLQTTSEQLTQSAPHQLCQELDEQLHRQPWWRRWMVRRWHERVRNTVFAAQVQAAEQALSSFTEGFGMMQTRLARILADNNIQRIDQTGCRVDPARMTVVELVTETDLPSETVVEVVRVGYLWGEQVVRYAEVRAVSAQPREKPPEGTDMAENEHNPQDQNERLWDEGTPAETRSISG